LADIEAICQGLEGVFSGWKRQQTSGSPESFDTLHRAVDMIRDLLAAPEMGRSSGKQKQRDELIRQLGRMEPRSNSTSRRKAPGVAAVAASPAVAAAPLPPRDEPSTALSPAAATATPPVVSEIPPAPPSSAQPPEQEKAAFTDTVRISIAKLDSRLLQAEDMLAVKAMTAQRAVELREIASHFEQWRAEWAKVSAEARALRQALERQPADPLAARGSNGSAAMVEFLDWNFAHIRSLENKLA